MSVLVKGGGMPETCFQCPCIDDSVCYCKAKEVFIPNPKKTPAWCPLVEIPTPHGKLVDLDAMVDKFWDGDYMEIHCRDLGDIPVIVEAEADHGTD